MNPLAAALRRLRSWFGGRGTDDAPARPPGRPMILDPDAESADPELPAFLARPEGAPVYHGFGVVPESATDGWLYGMISGFEDDEPATDGDGFVIAPDGSRAGIAWTTDSPEFYEIMPPEPGRWGVYGVRFPHPVANVDDLVANFRAVLPHLQRRFAELQAERD